ncbi:DNA helicase MCM8 [Fopius arisanus]|uniref:DNA helicase MCM8 n=1 Tax=Fopius arisanus TaxID=64838 RepID=A0A0C9RG25_9HYME|nr:PREDICTED: DNA helicase MCM8 [Fopius arisanus]XP_011304593.1 PREDICTED: DNA helicase MCM8 [Fopius arisanus]XP_011304594.1 PREDICTED: DNA helicase MCM8 [Fopius arisanus]
MNGPRRWSKAIKRKRKSQDDVVASKEDEVPDPPEDPDNNNKDDPTLDVYEAQMNSDLSLYGFHLYFDKLSKITEKRVVEKSGIAQGFFTRNPDALVPSKSGPSFNLDMKRFSIDKEFVEEWENFPEDMEKNPRETLNILGLALHQVLVNSKLNGAGINSGDDINLPTIRVNIVNYRPLVALRDIMIDSYGKLIGTRGCVIRVGRPKYMAQWLPFSCDKCSNWMVMRQPDGIYKLPKKCKTCGTCKFTPRLDSPHVKSIPFLVIKLQEHFDDNQDDKGKMPRVVEVELVSDLVESCMPGDDITVVGIVKIRGTDDGNQNKKTTAEANALYIEAVSIVNNKNKARNRTALGVDLDHQDYIFIKNIHDSHDVFSLLVRSLCPAIYGNEIIKAGLLLSLFGGCAKHDSLRNDLHVLLVGDPGLGKSQLLQACSRISTKGVYVCGNSSTTSGLTVTLTKENGTNDFALEPGALVLADKGTCFIDEFDKMPTQHQALLEAMEQSSVSVAKSGIICSLPARTSIVAAANPIGGKYNKSKSFTDNLNLSEPLLSRFDLIFLLLDVPSEQMDTLMCAHVMSAHRGSKIVAPSRSSSSLTEFNPPGHQTLITLRERLTLSSDDLIPQSILRKYVSYARLYVKPRLSPDAANRLKDYYLSLRQNISSHLPIFHRQLEALIRLTEARAKLELRTEATDADAQEVIEIYKYTLASVPSAGAAGPGVSHDSGKITGKKVSAFISLLQQLELEGGQALLSKTDLMEIANQGGIVINEFSRFINKLNDEGILIKRGHDLYKFVNL